MLTEASRSYKGRMKMKSKEDGKLIDSMDRARVTSGVRLMLLCFVVILWLSACAGSGEGLDEFGNLLGDTQNCPSDVPLGPTLESLQANIFTPKCIVCHAGASAPMGLVLECGKSYNMLVGVTSGEVDTLYRVNPGSPDDSYLVMKVEGAVGIVGGQMPLSPPDPGPLSQAEIDAVRAWITEGAVE